jgi:hypothetical protein
MSATQQERMQHARSGRGRARGSGYLDGLYGIESRRLAEHPDYRFAYKAGYSDGERARSDAMASHDARRVTPVYQPQEAQERTEGAGGGWGAKARPTRSAERKSHLLALPATTGGMWLEQSCR